MPQFRTPCLRLAALLALVTVAACEGLHGPYEGQDVPYGVGERTVLGAEGSGWVPEDPVDQSEPAAAD